MSTERKIWWWDEQGGEQRLLRNDMNCNVPLGVVNVARFGQAGAELGIQDSPAVVVFGKARSDRVGWRSTGEWALMACPILPGDDIETLKESMLHLTRMHYADQLKEK